MAYCDDRVDVPFAPNEKNCTAPNAADMIVLRGGRKHCSSFKGFEEDEDTNH